MNILEAEDIIKGLPDQALFEEAQMPSGQVPQFLVVSEIQRRSDMRKRFQEQQPNQGTVKDQIVQQGIMGAMPPQMPTPMPTGMPTPMPTGMPTEMPAQGMFSGGIIRLAGGGSTGMPGEYALVPLIEKAKDIARITGGKVEDIYNHLVRQAQENMPDYSMIAPAGVGDLPSLPEGAGSNIPEMFQSGRDANTQLASLPRLPEGAGSNFPETFQSGRDVNDQLASPPSGSLPSGANFLSSIAEGMRQTPFGKYSRAAEQGIMDVYEKDGLGAAIGEAGRAGLGGLLSLGETVAEGYKPAAKALVGATDYLTSGPSRALDQFLTGSTEDPLTLGDIAGYFSGGPQEGDLDQLQEVTVDAKAREYAPELKAILETAQANTQDESKKVDGVAGSKEVQGTSPIQNQGRADRTEPNLGTEPSLDFSDLLADMKKQTMAQSLVQLGAGIAGGDLSKGISAAGLTAMKGDELAKDMAIKQRLAEYGAGREDQDRERKKYEFDTLLAQAERKIGAELRKAERVSKGQLISFVADIVKEAAPDYLEEGQSRQEVIEALTQQLLMKYGPFLDVDVSGMKMGMPKDQGARTPEQIKAIYGV